MTRPARSGQTQPDSTATAALPTAFNWRGVRYVGLEVLSTWHLMDRWWEASNSCHPRGGYTDRHYYRVMCELRAFAILAICEVYADRVANTWVMDFVHA